VPYGIEVHSHLFAAWAAGRAASVKNCRFTVVQGRTILESIGFTPELSNPDHLPKPSDVDAAHRTWREEAITSGGTLGLTITHGVAAKLINLYLKARFVCAGHHAHAHVASLHPPIDSVLLRALAQHDFGGQSQALRKVKYERWSKLKSNEIGRAHV
jgi:hypothetical protein